MNAAFHLWAKICVIHSCVVEEEGLIDEEQKWFSKRERMQGPSSFFGIAGTNANGPEFNWYAGRGIH